MDAICCYFRWFLHHTDGEVTRCLTWWRKTPVIPCPYSLVCFLQSRLLLAVCVFLSKIAGGDVREQQSPRKQNELAAAGMVKCVPGSVYIIPAKCRLLLPALQCITRKIQFTYSNLHHQSFYQVFIILSSSLG